MIVQPQRLGGHRAHQERARALFVLLVEFARSNPAWVVRVGLPTVEQVEAVLAAAARVEAMRREHGVVETPAEVERARLLAEVEQLRVVVAAARTLDEQLDRYGHAYEGEDAVDALRAALTAAEGTPA